MLCLKPLTGTREQYILEKGKTAVIPPGVLKERGIYEVIYKGSERPKLYLSGGEVPSKYTEIREMETFIKWEIPIEDHTGEVTLELISQNGAECWTLDIAPHEGKLGRDAYSELLEELNNKIEGLVFDAGHGRAGANISAHGVDNAPGIEKFILLKTYMRTLQKAFNAIKEEPQRRLIAERQAKRLSQARRSDKKTLISAARKPGLVAAITHQRSNLGYCTDPNPYFDLPARIHTFNTPANCYVKEVLCRIQRMILELQQSVAKLVNVDNPITRSRLTRWLKELDNYSLIINTMKNAFFLKNISPTPPDTAALLAILGHPAYTRFERVTRRILYPRASLGFDNSLFNLRCTWQVYEYWVFFRIAELVQQAWPELTWSFPELNGRGFVYDIPDYTRMVGKGQDIEVKFVFQRKFNSYSFDKQCDEFFSISKTLIPDYIIQVKTRHKTKLIILDAKYRTNGQSIHEGLRDIHVYRDALRNGQSLAGAWGAFIITPGHCGGSESLYFTSEYRDKHKFGCFILKPGGLDQAYDFIEMLHTAKVKLMS